MFKNRRKSFAYAINGLRIAFSEEANFRIHFFSAIIVTTLGLYFDLTQIDWLILLLTMAIVIIVELLNTAIENICDFVSPGHNAHIGRIKDVAAAAVLVSAIMAFAVGVIVFWPYIF